MLTSLLLLAFIILIIIFIMRRLRAKGLTSFLRLVNICQRFIFFIQYCLFFRFTSAVINGVSVGIKHIKSLCYPWSQVTPCRWNPSHSRSDGCEMDVTEVNVCTQEERRFGEFQRSTLSAVLWEFQASIRGLEGAFLTFAAAAAMVCLSTEQTFKLFFLCLDYKNNLLKEKVRANSPPKVIDLDEGMDTSENLLIGNQSHMFLLSLSLGLYLCFLQRCWSSQSEKQTEGLSGPLAGPKAALHPSP